VIGYRFDPSIMSDCDCQKASEEIQVRSVLVTLLTINGIMFLVEIVLGVLADSTSLVADSLDMLADATVGIAMGAAGSDVALETADVALMADNLDHLPFAIGLSRKTSRIIKQNLWFSLGMVGVLIPSTVFGMNMGVAVLFHKGSTLLVVFNALRLLAYREEPDTIRKKMAEQPMMPVPK